MCWACVSHTGKKENAYRVLVDRFKGKGSLERLGRTRNDTNKLSTKKIYFADRES
jgi:hypothetical protein